MTASTHRLPLGAVLGVLLSGLLLLATAAGTATPDRPGRGVRVQGAAGSFLVGTRWSPTSTEAVLYYADDAGRPVVGLTGAVVADAGWCAGLPTSTRGFAGFVEPGGLATLPGRGGPESVARAVAAAWSEGVSGRPPPRAAVRTTRLVDATPAARTTVRLRTRPSADPCVARRVVLDVVAFDTPTGPAALVVVRDVDPQGVDAGEVEEVVQSLRRRT